MSYEVIVTDASNNEQIRELFSFYEEALITKESYEEILRQIPVENRGTVSIKE